MDDLSYKTVLYEGKPKLRRAGFSDAEIHSWLREYGQDIRNKNSPDYIRERINASAKARHNRLMHGRKIYSTASFPGEEVIFAGLLGTTAGIAALVGCGIASAISSDIKYFETGACLMLGLPFGAMLFTSFYGAVGGFND